MSKFKHENHDQYEFRSIKVPLETGGKLMIHFKRLPTEQSTIPLNVSLYENLQKIVQQSNTNQQIPYERSLIAINFDQPFEEKLLKKIFQISGKVRQVFKGMMKFQQTHKIFVSLIIFKNEFDLTKCFELDYFQQKICEKFKVSKDEFSKVKYQESLLQKYETRDPQKDQIFQEAEEDGFQVVTDKHGDFSLNLQLNEELLQKSQKKSKKKTKKDIDISEFIQGSFRPSKEVIKQKKQQLAEEFEQDKQYLKEMRLKKKIKQ